jgi:hypothetical protein
MNEIQTIFQISLIANKIFEHFYLWHSLDLLIDCLCYIENHTFENGKKIDILIFYPDCVNVLFLLTLCIVKQKVHSSFVGMLNLNKLASAHGNVLLKMYTNLIKRNSKTTEVRYLERLLWCLSICKLSLRTAKQWDERNWNWIHFIICRLEKYTIVNLFQWFILPSNADEK